MSKKLKTTFIVVRHGQTSWNAVDRFQGHIDTELSITGHKQAEAVGARFHNIDIDVLYSSDLKRAHQTAEAIARVRKLEIITDQRLRERHMGVFQGKTFAEIKQEFPDGYAQFMRWDPDYRIPEGETNREKYQRVVDFFEEKAKQHKGKIIAVVTHGGVVDALFRYTIGLPLSQPRRYKNFNVSINRFYRYENNWLLGTWGEVTHLLDYGLEISQAKNASL